MKSQDIHITDFIRILLGEVPVSFFIEVIIRTLFVFLLLVVSMRLLGRRMPAMLDMHELSALVALAAAIGVPIQSPDRGLLPAVVVAFTVVFLQKTIFKESYNYKKLELIFHGDIVILIEDGVMNLSQLKKALITRDRVFAQLRASEIKNMGEVKRLYLETNGNFTLLKQVHEVPGLSIIPVYDKELTEEDLTMIPDILVCKDCGQTKSKTDPYKDSCSCSTNNWENAVLRRA